MLKILTVVMAIIASIMAVLAYSTILPELSDNVNANAEAIADNSTYIENLDNAVNGIDTRVETLEGKKLYIHYCKLYSSNGSYIIFNFIDNNSNIDYTTLAGKNVLANGIRTSDGKYFTNVTYSTGVGLTGYISSSSSTSVNDWTKVEKTERIL